MVGGDIAHGLGDGDEHRPVAERAVGLGADAEFFGEFSPGGGAWVFAGFDVAAGGEPAAGDAVIDEEGVFEGRVDDDGVGDEMPRWGGGLGGAPQRRTGVDPVEDLSPVSDLGVVERVDRGDEVAGRSAHLGVGLAHRSMPVRWAASRRCRSP